MNSYCKITLGQPTTIAINISQDQQSRQNRVTGRGSNCMNFFEIKIVRLTVGKEVTHFPTKQEAHKEKEDCNSTHPMGAC
jgi:hypothetical protein